MNTNKIKFTTIALNDNQHLIKDADRSKYCSTYEMYCLGYTENKRDKNLDGYYYRKDLQVIK